MYILDFPKRLPHDVFTQVFLYGFLGNSATTVLCLKKGCLWRRRFFDNRNILQEINIYDGFVAKIKIENL